MRTHHEPAGDGRVAGPAQVVAPTGDIDVETIGPVRAALETAARGPVVILDAADISFADSTFLSLLLSVRQRTDLRIAGAPAHLLRLLTITGADRILPLYPDVAQAQAGPPPAAG
jgi:anti-anti-sigma factor